MYYLLVCRSLTYAQRTAKTLERAGISAIVTKLPQSITIDGCGYCVKVSGRYFTDALITLRNAEMYPNRVFALYSDGNFGEVEI